MPLSIFVHISIFGQVRQPLLVSSPDHPDSHGEVFDHQVNSHFYSHQLQEYSIPVTPKVKTLGSIHELMHNFGQGTKGTKDKVKQARLEFLFLKFQLSFQFDCFYIVDFHSALTFLERDLQSED